MMFGFLMLGLYMMLGFMMLGLMDKYFWGDLISIFFFSFMMLCIAYISIKCMENQGSTVPHTEQDQMSFEENWLDHYINENFPSSSELPAAVMVPEEHSASALRTNQFIGKCIVCLAPTAARCSGCRAVLYCSRKCQLIHWREHKEKCHQLSSSTNAAARPRPQMDFLVGLNLQHCGNDVKKGAIQDTSSDQSDTKTEKFFEGHNVSKSKQRGQQTSIYRSRSSINQVEGQFLEKNPMRGTAGCSKPSNSSQKSVHLLDELQDNKLTKKDLLEFGNPEDVPFQTSNNSMQTHETNRLEQELKKLKKLQHEPLNENNALKNMHNNLAKELEGLRQHEEEQASKNNDVINFMEFSYLELKEATNNFDEKLKIGEGGYGIVYKAVLRCTTVAIKILRTGGHQGEREFYQEVKFLGKVRHPNIVALMGGCSQNLALVYEYIPNRSLDYYLGAATGRRSLSWKQRIEIASNICSALVFLHSSKPHGIAHGDLKPANILLDSNYQGKLSDFGISRQLKKTDYTITFHHLTDQPKGTPGYIDQEYLRTGEMTPQCDIYSFGIILLQLVTGKPAIYGKPPTGIYTWVREALKSNTLNKEIDSSAEWPSDKAIKMAKLGLDCCNPNSKERPKLATKVWHEIESLKPDD